MIGLFLLAQAAAMPGMAMPAAAEPVCIRAEVVPGFESWSAAGGAALAVGTPAALTLRPIASVAFSPPLGRPGAPSTFGGSFTFAVRQAGDYRIALSEGAWIDVVKEGAKLDSKAHMHGPACTGIAKIVTFALEPGTYLMQLSATKAPSIKAMVAAGG